MKIKQLLKQNFALTVLGLLSISAFAQTPCEGGFAGSYPCDGYDLQSEISLSEMDASTGNDSWGWTDPQDGKEYALIGLNNGTAFIDISNPTSPIYLGKLPTQTGSSLWRDLKVFDNHAFIVSEATNHGMQIFDLTRLRNVANPPQTFTIDAIFNGFGSAHNIAINEDTGFAYPIGARENGGSNPFINNGGPIFIDVNDPLNPVEVGGFGANTHDAQIVIYDGPDNDYNDGNTEIFIGSNDDRVTILDVTNKNNPVLITELMYSNAGFAHQGWLTEDHRFFILGDEQDETDFGFNTRTIVFDLLDLDAQTPPRFEYFGPVGSVDHNGYVVDDQLFLSNYRAGIRVIDISDIENGNIFEEAFFDSFPANNNVPASDGAWNVYPFFASKNIVISDISSGFLLVKDAKLLGVNNQLSETFTIAPNPASTNITIKSQSDPIKSIEVFNVLGQQVINQTYDDGLTKNIDISKLNAGMYLVKVNQNTVSRLIKN